MNSQTSAARNSAAPVTSDAVLSGHQISKRVSGPEGELTILHALDIEIHAGEAVAIVGPSGSGKSTLLGILAGLDTPTQGTVELLHQPMSTMEEDSRARLRAGKVGFVFQSFQLLPGLTALENVMLPLELTGEPDAAKRARVMLAKVGLQHREGHQPLQLSGGEQQRVALARAFVSEPAILFADEPTGNLDGETGEKVVELMFSLTRQQGSAVVLVTHDRDLARRCDRTLLMGNGRLEAI